ncbi:MAG: ABC transporter ATP-binding protein [Actinomycetota bacterium]
MLLQIENLTKTYKKGVRANDGISLGVEAGEVFGLLGPNGAGKTTLVGQVLGSIRPDGGSITLDGVDVVRNPSYSRRACSYQPQTSLAIEGLTPIEAIEITGRIRGGRRPEVRKRGMRLIETLQLEAWATRKIPLSGGVTRLVTFCMAAVVPGRVVVLDEPTNDVDPLRRKLLWQTVRELADQGSAVLLVTHNVLEAERCVDRLAIIDSGRVVSMGSAAAVKRDFGQSLRLEITLEPDREVADFPQFVEGTVRTGRRLIAEVTRADLPEAIDWATALRDRGLAEEFSVGPATLEDVYVRSVRQGAEEEPSYEVA